MLLTILFSDKRFKMRKIVLLITIYFFGLNVFAERNITVLKNNKWNICAEKPISASDVKNKGLNFFFPGDSALSIINEGNPFVSTIVYKNDLQAGKLVLSIEKGALFFEVWIDGQKMENLLSNEDFLTHIANQSESDEILLTLVKKTGQKIDLENLRSILQNITITSLSGIVISWLSPKKDQYFGCPMLEIHVLNTLEKDIDGKLIARILKPNTFELIAENNNCAFSRSGMETTIEIIFPNTQSTLLKGKYIAEVMMLDKENEEEIVDHFTVQIQLE